MNDLLGVLLLAIPLFLAYFVGRWSSGLRTLPSLIIMVLLSLYPMAHWFLLRLERDTFLDLNWETKVWAAGLTSLLMLIEVPLCAVKFLLARAIARRKRNRL